MMVVSSGLVLATIAACGDGAGAADDAGLPRGDASIDPAALLTLETEPSITLVFGESEELAVRYTEADGSPIAGARLQLALVGRAHDSSLRELDAITDEDGVARGVVMAGMVAAAFRVRVTAERAVPVHFDVSVSNAGFGGLRVRLDYDGERMVSDRTLDVFAGRTCSEERTWSDPGDRSKTLAEEESDVRFFALPAGIEYAVVGRGRGPGGELLAWGCIDEVYITADEETDARVFMRDLDLVVDGDYEVQADLDATRPVMTLAERIASAGATTVAAAGGDASLMLDALDTMLRNAGMVTEADELAMQRADGMLDSSLGSSLSTAGVGPSIAVDELSTLVEARAERVRLTGALVVSDAIPSFRMGPVSARSTDASLAPLPIDFASLGVEPAADMTATWLFDQDAMQLDELRVALPLGSLGLGLMQALAAEAGADGTAALLLPSGGCETFQSWGATQPVVSDSCDDACVLMVCKSALEEVAAPIQAALLSLDTERSMVLLEGRVELEDTEGDLRVDSLQSPALSGAWTPPDGSTGDAVTGMLSGSRVIE